MPVPDLPTLIDRTRAGDGAAFRALVGELYDELRRIARAQRRRLGAADTVNTTAVVHEAYARLNDRPARPPYADADHFLRVAARTMRDVIVDYARVRQAAKRGGGLAALPLLDHDGATDGLDPAEILSVHDALDALEALDAETARVAELRYFGGLSVVETAEALGLSSATVKRRWAVAQAWLHRRLDDPPAPGPAIHAAA